VTGRDLTIALADLAIEFPEVPELDFEFTRLGSPARLPVWTLRWAAVVVVAVVVAVVAFVGPVREAVADWFGIGVVHIVEVDELPEGLSDSFDLGEAIPVDSVRMVWPDSLGRPDGAFVGATELSLVWLPETDLPEVGSSGVGGLLTRFGGSLEGPVVEKLVGGGSTVVSVTVGDEPGFWIEGEPHTFGYLDSQGEIVLGTIRLAGNTLLWEVGGVSHRFESGLPMADAVRLMEGVR
jgi:hypothetical protein